MTPEPNFSVTSSTEFRRGHHGLYMRAPVQVEGADLRSSSTHEERP
jgi:hypothetical protein